MVRVERICVCRRSLGPRFCSNRRTRIENGENGQYDLVQGDGKKQDWDYDVGREPMRKWRAWPANQQPASPAFPLWSPVFSNPKRPPKAALYFQPTANCTCPLGRPHNAQHRTARHDWLAANIKFRLRRSRQCFDKKSFVLLLLMAICGCVWFCVWLGGHLRNFFGSPRVSIPASYLYVVASPAAEVFRESSIKRSC